MALKKKHKKIIPHGVVYINATFNNTIINVTDLKGNSICWASAGTAGFSGTKKGTPFAAQKAASLVAKKAREQFNMEKVAVFVKGPGSGRETAIRAIQASGLKIVVLRDITPIPHNGCRPPGRRRV